MEDPFDDYSSCRSPSRRTGDGGMPRKLFSSVLPLDLSLLLQPLDGKQRVVVTALSVIVLLLQTCLL